MPKPAKYTREKEVVAFSKAANSFPKLTFEEEQQASRAWLEHKDFAARELLVNAHLRYVVQVAFMNRRYGIPLPELFSVGTQGLMHAADQFEPDRGLRFLTFASYWIRADIGRYIQDQQSVVPFPKHQLRGRVFYRLSKERAKWEGLLGIGQAANDKIVEALTCGGHEGRESTVQWLIDRMNAPDDYLDAPVQVDGEDTYSRTSLLVSDTDDPEVLAAEAERTRLCKEAIEKAISTLEPRHQVIARGRLYPPRGQLRSFRVLAEELNLTRQRIQQIEVIIRQKLRCQLAPLRELDQDAA